MLKKLFLSFLVILFLVSCAPQENSSVDFKSPTYPPDPAKIKPDSGPSL